MGRQLTKARRTLRLWWRFDPRYKREGGIVGRSVLDWQGAWPHCNGALKEQCQPTSRPSQPAQDFHGPRIGQSVSSPHSATAESSLWEMHGVLVKPNVDFRERQPGCLVAYPPCRQRSTRGTPLVATRYKSAKGNHSPQSMMFNPTQRGLCLDLPPG